MSQNTLTEARDITQRGRIRAGVHDYLMHIRMFSANARWFMFGAFLMGVNFEVFQLLLNLYFKELKFGEGEMGWINSSRALGMTLMAIPGSMLFTRFHIRPLLLAGVAGFALFSAMLVMTQQVWILMGLTLITGISWSLFRVFSGPFYMHNSTPVERSHLFSFSFAVLILAGMVGSAGAGKLVTLVGTMTGDMIFGYKFTLITGVLIGTLAMFPFAMVTAREPMAAEERISLNFGQLKSRGGFYVRLIFVNFLIGIGAGLIIPFLNLYFKERFNLQPDVIGLFFLAVSASMFLGTLSGPLLARKFGLVRSVAFTQLASLPFMVMLAYTNNVVLAFVAFVVRGGLMNLNAPISSHLAMEMSTERERPLVNALLMISWTASWMIAVAIGGELVERHGFTLVLNIAAGLYLVSSLLYYYFFRGIEKRRDDDSGWHIPEATV
jgi:predicted MFS family arabinose efflux permease